MAGSEQMNFLVATNYSTAKINLEQYKSQVPAWLVEESNMFASGSVNNEETDQQVSSLQ